jgi:hypothetical protein
LDNAARADSQFTAGLSDKRLNDLHSQSLVGTGSKSSGRVDPSLQTDSEYPFPEFRSNLIVPVPYFAAFVTNSLMAKASGVTVVIGKLVSIASTMACLGFFSEDAMAENHGRNPRGIS